MRSRAPKRRNLSVDEVVARAAEVMRTDGEGALTMRRVADECGVTPMALYHHVADKEDLVRLVIDDLVAESLGPPPSDGVDWRDAMVDFTTKLRSVVLSNPGAASAWIRRPVTGPNMALVTERFFAIVAMGGLTGVPAADAVDAVVLVLFGSLTNDLTRPPEVRRQLLEHRPAEDTPHMVRNIEPYAHRDPERRFRAALRWLVDGIERDARASAVP